MKTFIYTYKNDKNKILKGTISANTKSQAKAFLRTKRIYPSAIVEEQKPFFNRAMKEKKPKEDDVIIFTQLFSSCLHTGLTIKDSLQILLKQMTNKPMKKRITQIIMDIENGQPLSLAFSKHDDIFPAFYPMIVKAGEATGDLGNAMDYIATYMDRINALKKEIIGAFTYPIAVCSIGFCLMIIILTYVAPTFKQVFQDAKIALPFPTQLLFFLSDILSRYSVPIIILIVLSVLTAYFYKQTPNGIRWFERALFSIPAFGSLIKTAIILRFLKIFDILVNNDVPILEALRVLESGTMTMTLKDIITEMRKDVSKGLPLSGPVIHNASFFGPLISSSISTGEKAGNLKPTLSRLSLFVDRELTFIMKRISSKIDPILTAIIGLLVLFIALAVYLPIFDMMTKHV